MRKLAIGVVLFVGVTAASAGVTVYTSETAFQAAIGPTYLFDNFDATLPYGLIEPGWMIGPQNGFAGYATADPNGLWGCSGPYGMALSTNNAYDPIVIDFGVSPTPVYATGGWFFPSDFNCMFIPGQQIEVTLFFETGPSQVFAYIPTNWNDFRGFVSDVRLTGMSVDAPDVPSLAWSAIDNYYIGIPEPASLILLAAAGLLLRRR